MALRDSSPLQGRYLNADHRERAGRTISTGRAAGLVLILTRDLRQPADFLALGTTRIRRLQAVGCVAMRARHTITTG
jgi:hypothetical protein